MFSMGLDKLNAYKYLWGIIDHEMEKLFPGLDGFWSSKTFEIYKSLSTKSVSEMFIGSHWINVDQCWVCPVCKRDKLSIARIGKSDKIILDIHEHHDHSCQIFNGVGQCNIVSEQLLYVQRFKPTLICAECNVAEGNVKSALNLVSWFTFSPSEISQFIEPVPNKKHKIIKDVALEIYDIEIDKLRERIEFAQCLSDKLFNDSAFIKKEQSKSFEILEAQSGIPGSFIAWALVPRSRSHYYTTKYRPKLKEGVFIPF